MCGTCCRDITLVIEGQVIRDVHDLRDLIRRYPGYACFRPTGRDKRGNITVSCVKQADDGTCSDHENRLDLCRGHPGRAHYFSGADLHRGCSFRFEETARFSTVLRREKWQARRERKKARDIKR